MDKLKAEFIKAIMTALKIEHNPFIVGTISDFVSVVPPQQYGNFMTQLFGTQHAFLNGIDRVAKVAETFKPVETKDEIAEQAEELIALVYSMNNKVFNDAQNQKVLFEDLIQQVKFPNLSEETIAILNQVKPYTNYKRLISNISCYDNGTEQLRAFKNALEQNEKVGTIENSRVAKMIRG